MQVLNEDFYTQSVSTNSGTAEVKRPNTLVTSVRFRIKSLARIAKFMQLNGQIPVSTSEIVKEGLNLLNDIIIKQFPMADFYDETSAFEFLKSLNLMGQSQRNKRRLQGILANDSLVQTKQENSFDQLGAFREIAQFMMQTEGAVNAVALEKAQMTVVNGKLVKNEEISGLNSGNQRIKQLFQENNFVDLTPAEKGIDLSPMSMPLGEFRQAMLAPCADAPCAEEETK